MNVLKMTEQDLAGKRVLIRVDFNVPIENGVVTSDARIRAALPTIRQALEAGAAVMLMSHLGRPQEGVSVSRQPELSLDPVARHLGQLLGCAVPLVENWIDGCEVASGSAVLLENVRFLVGEKKDEEVLARKMAELCDVFVMDAFGTAHRAQASTHGVARFAPVACAGPLLVAELEALASALEEPARPLVALVGGSKVSTKLEVLNSLATICDQLIVGGGIANTFLAAQGCPVGKSLYEPDMLDVAARLLEKVTIPVPEDVMVALDFSDEEATLRDAREVRDQEMILDIGPQTAATLGGILESAGTIIWNGPVGVFEKDAFAEGTRSTAMAIAKSDAFSIAGGGDTLAAIEKFGVGEEISYISTGGGAFLEFVEGKTLPAVAILEQRAAQN